MSLFNDLFVNSDLQSRTDQLNSIWQSLSGQSYSCSWGGGTQVQFDSDYQAWFTYYKSGDFDDAETNSWQTKAQTWSNDFAAFGCGTPSDIGATSSGIPTVKDPPPNQQAPLAKAASGIGDAIKNALASIWTTIETAGIVVAVVIVLILSGIVYLLTHTNVSTPTASIGPAK